MLSNEEDCLPTQNENTLEQIYRPTTIETYPSKYIENTQNIALNDQFEPNEIIELNHTLKTQLEHTLFTYLIVTRSKSRILKSKS